MLPKANRASTKEVEQIFKKGKILNSPNLTLRFIMTGASGKKISVIAPKSVSNSAVRRNLIRRHGYDALSTLIGKFPSGILGTLIFKKAERDIPTLQNEISTILSKIH